MKKAVDRKSQFGREDVPFGRQNASSHFPNGIDIGDPPPRLCEFLLQSIFRDFSRERLSAGFFQ
jgi:hypothetical protein